MATDLSEAPQSRKVERAGQVLQVKDVRLFGIGGGKLALELTFGGDVTGHIYFVGTPRYDAGTNELFVPDLDDDVGSKNTLVSGVEWVKHDEIRDFFRNNARWSSGRRRREGATREGLTAIREWRKIVSRGEQVQGGR